MSISEYSPPKDQRLLVVVEDERDFPAVLKEYNATELWGPYVHEWSSGYIYIVEAKKMWTQICGIQVHDVRFWEGMYSSNEIGYALGRVRYKRDSTNQKD
jgi:hypothetical protein